MYDVSCILTLFDITEERNCSASSLKEKIGVLFFLGRL